MNTLVEITKGLINHETNVQPSQQHQIQLPSTSSPPQFSPQNLLGELPKIINNLGSSNQQAQPASSPLMPIIKNA